jgi:hypothetical protein
VEPTYARRVADKPDAKETALEFVKRARSGR